MKLDSHGSEIVRKLVSTKRIREQLEITFLVAVFWPTCSIQTVLVGSLPKHHQDLDSIDIIEQRWAGAHRRRARPAGESSPARQAILPSADALDLFHSHSFYASISPPSFAPSTQGSRCFVAALCSAGDLGLFEYHCVTQIIRLGAPSARSAAETSAAVVCQLRGVTSFGMDSLPYVTGIVEFCGMQARITHVCAWNVLAATIKPYTVSHKIESQRGNVARYDEITGLICCFS